MQAHWHKVFRDLNRNRSRSFLVVLAITIGLSGFASLLSTYSILTRELNAGYLATNPASGTLVIDRAGTDLLNSVPKFPGVAEIEARGSIAARVRLGTNEWRNAILFVIPDYRAIRISTLKPEAGKWPPDTGEILIERDALGVAQAKVGDTLPVKTTRGTEQGLRIAGTVHDVGQAQARMEQIVYGYITLPTLQMLGESPYLNELKFTVDRDPMNEQHIRDVANALKSNLERKGLVVKSIEIPIPGKHPHADLMGMLLLFKAAFGFFALLLSGFLVFNLFSAIMAREVRQIGIMKAVGAKRIQIAGLYLREILLFSATAILLALPISTLAAIGIANFMARFLNFDLNDYSVAPWVYVLEVAVGLAVPLIAAGHPIWKASRRVVRESLTDYGIYAGEFGRSITDQMISRIGGSMRPLLLSFRNLFLNGKRLIFTLATLVAGGAIFIAAWNVRASFVHTIDLMFHTFRFDIAVSLSDPHPIDQVRRQLSQIHGVARVECWSSAEATPVLSGGSENNSFRIAGLPDQSTMLALNIVEGQNLKQADPFALIVNNRLQKEHPELRVGSRISLRIGSAVHEWRVAGLSREPFAGPAAYAPAETLANLTGQTGTTKNIRIAANEHNPEFVHGVKRNVEKALADNGWRATSVTAIQDRRIVIDEHNSVIYALLIGVALLIVMVGGLGLMTSMSINVLERRREIGVMRAIGASRKAMISLILAEGSLVGAFSWTLSIIPAFLISKGLGNLVAGMMFHTNLDFAADPVGIVVWLVLTLIFGAIASYIPASNASRLPVRALIEYE